MTPSRQTPSQQRLHISGIDIVPNRPHPLSTNEQLTARVAKRMLHVDTDINARVPTGLKRLTQRLVERRLLDHSGEEVVEGNARIIPLEQTLHVRDQLVDLVSDDGREQRFLARKVPVHGTRTDPSTLRDLVELYHDTFLGERLASRCQHPRPVAAGIRAQRRLRTFSGRSSRRPAHHHGTALLTITDSRSEAPGPRPVILTCDRLSPTIQARSDTGAIPTRTVSSPKPATLALL